MRNKTTSTRIISAVRNEELRGCSTSMCPPPVMLGWSVTLSDPTAGISYKVWRSEGSLSVALHWIATACIRYRKQKTARISHVDGLSPSVMSGWTVTLSTTACVSYRRKNCGDLQLEVTSLNDVGLGRHTSWYNRVALLLRNFINFVTSYMLFNLFI